MLRLRKKGVAYGIVIAIIALLIIGFIIYAFSTGESKVEEKTSTTLSDIFTGEDEETKLNLDTRIKNDFNRDIVKFIFQYIFGMHKGILENLEVNGTDINNLSIRGVMIIISVWLIFFLVFTDMSIIAGFSNNKLIGFLVGISVTVIFANFGLYYNIIIWLMGIFAFLAGLSVIAALMSIIILGVGAHFGLGWALQAIKTKREIWQIKSGAEKAAAGVGVAKKLAEAAES